MKEERCHSLQFISCQRPVVQ